MSVPKQDLKLTGDGKRRRRLWSAAEKRAIVEETFEPDASVSVVARRHDVNANMLFTWRRQAAEGASPAAGAGMTFVPANITAERAAMASPTSPVSTSRIEIALASGDRLIVGSDVDAAALARVVKVLSRR
jgi:transposase